MGQKVHPTGSRLGIATDWTSKWYAGNANYADYLHEDLKIREFLKKKLSQAAVSRISIARPTKSVVMT
jgi:small subunit ribosomal protein S3